MLKTQIDDDVYLLIGEAYRSNSTAFISQDEVLLVDALGSMSDAEELKQFVEIELRKEVRFNVCTHFFSDHLAALKLLPRATVIAHKNYLDTFNSELYRSREEESHFHEPDILISDGMKIKWGDHVLDVFHNPGHTTSTLTIDVQDANLLLVSDTLVGNIVYLTYSTPERLTTALDQLQTRARNRLLSSHGDLRSSAAIFNAQFYLESLRNQTSKARASAEGEQSILQLALETCLPSGVEPSKVERMYHTRNLHTILERNIFAPAA
jgi:glyoxylase-like metal-dependent hydrolase (beta-lactamase superfamily II)